MKLMFFFIVVLFIGNFANAELGDMQEDCNDAGQCLYRAEDKVLYKDNEKNDIVILFNLTAPFSYIDINANGQWVALVSQSLFSGLTDTNNDIKHFAFPADIQLGGAMINEDGKWIAVSKSFLFFGSYNGDSERVNLDEPLKRIKNIDMNPDAFQIESVTEKGEEFYIEVKFDAIP